MKEKEEPLGKEKSIFLYLLITSSIASRAQTTFQNLFIVREINKNAFNLFYGNEHLYVFSERVMSR